MKHLIISISTGVALALAALAQAKQEDNNTSTTTVHRGSRGNSQAQVAPAGHRVLTPTWGVRTQTCVFRAPPRSDPSTPPFKGNAVGPASTSAEVRGREPQRN